MTNQHRVFGKFSLALLAILFLSARPSAAQIIEIASSSAVTGALVTVSELNGWTLEMVGANQDRQLRTDDDVLQDLSAEHRGALVGYAVRPWLNAEIGVGAAKPEVGGIKGEFGFDWISRVRVALVKYALESSPVYGVTHSVTLESEVSYSQANARLSDERFRWSELMVAPSVVYTVDYRDSLNWIGFDPRSADVRAGLLYSGVDGTWGSMNLGENRNFGWLAGLDVQFASDVVLSLTSYVLGQREVTMEAALGYRF